MAEKTTILVVDDDPMMLAIAARLLRAEGYRVETAATGEEALRMVRKVEPALVLLDVILPDVDGVEVSRQIKAAEDGARPYVILLSGVKTDPNDQAFGLESGADGYVARPVGNRELLARVEAMLRLKHVEEALAERREELERRTAELAATNARLREEVAERKRAEEALRENEARLVQQERLAAVGQLTAGLAHTFNSILQSMLLRAEMALSDRSLSPAAQRSLAEVKEQTEHAAHLVQKLLDFSGNALLARRQVDLAALVQKQVKQVRQQLPADVDVGVESHGSAVVRGDGRQLQQLVANLVQNAADAMPEGGAITVVVGRGPAAATCSVCHRPVDGEWVQLSVADDGEGIPPEAAPHIFEPFFTTRSPERSGLGLSQTLGIIEQHGGHIDVESEAGQGTRVTAYLRPFDEGD